MRFYTQYKNILKQAEWGDGLEQNHFFDVSALLDYFSRYPTNLDKDLDQPKRIILGFERLYSKPLDRITHENIADILQKIWPQKCAYIGADALNDFIGKSGGIAQKQFKLTGSDLVFYIAVSLYFGSNFGRDPLYPDQPLLIDPV